MLVAEETSQEDMGSVEVGGAGEHGVSYWSTEETSQELRGLPSKAVAPENINVHIGRRGDVPGVERDWSKAVAPVNMNSMLFHRGDVPGGYVSVEGGGASRNMAVMSVTRLRLGASVAR